MIFPFLIQKTYAVKVLQIFVIYRICHLKCHFDTIVAVCDGCHAWGRQCLLNPEQLLNRLVRFPTVTYNGKHGILDLSLVALYEPGRIFYEVFTLFQVVNYIFSTLPVSIMSSKRSRALFQVGRP